MYRWKESLRGDLWGGVNTAIVALPLAMAFGVESGLGASAGLVSAMVLGVVASLLGGTHVMITGPTAPMTLVSSLIIVEEFERNPDPATALTTIFIIFLLGGVFQIAFGLLRVGKYIQFVPYSLVAGFMNGIGIMMILFQVLPWLGHKPVIHLPDIFSGFAHLPEFFSIQAFALGAGTIAIVYLFPLVTRKIPPTLVALLGVSGISVIMGLNVSTLGSLPDEWIQWRWSHLIAFDKAQWHDVLIPALTIALLGAVDTLLTCMVVDMKTGGTHKSNKELIGQGVGNMVAAIAGGLPGTGAAARSMVNVRAGAKTRLSSIIHSVILLAVFLELGFIEWIPLPVLAAILITVGIDLLDIKGALSMFRISKNDCIVMVVVMLTTVFVGLLYGFAVGIILASLFFVKKMADQNTTKGESLLLIPDIENEINNYEPVYLSREVHIQELSGPLFFGFASHFKTALKALPDVRAVMFRMERVPFIDQSGIYALQDTLQHLKNKDIVLIFTGLQPDVRTQLRNSEIIPKLIEPEHDFNSFAYAADWLELYLKANPRKKVKKIDLRAELEIDKLGDRKN